MIDIPAKTARDYGLNDEDVRSALCTLRGMPSDIRKSAVCGGPPIEGPWWSSPEPTECYYAAILSILQKLDLVGKAILEVGCSLGYFVRVLSFLGSYAIGIDKDEDAIKDAEGVELIQGQIEKLPTFLANKEFDVVIQRLALSQYRPVKERAFMNIHSVLRSGGYFISQDETDEWSGFLKADLERVGFEVILQGVKWRFWDYDKNVTYYDEYESITIARKP